MIDMDDLIGDEDFFQPMTVWRRRIAYDGNGSPEWVPILVAPAPSGSIQSGANPELLRQQDMASTANMITIYTGFRLLCEGDTDGAIIGPEAIAETDDYGNQITPNCPTQFKADIVMYHGSPYEVFLVNDWTDYGDGFVAAIARMVSSAQARL